MKKIQTIAIVFFWTIPFLSEAKNTQSLCAEPNRKYIEENYSEECTKERNTELIASEIMKQETEYFDTYILDKAIQDNQSNANLLAHNTIHELRKESACLQEICFEIFKTCNPESISLQKTDTAKRWCQNKTYELFKLGQTKTLYAVNENFARKDRSLHRQKMNSLSSRFNNYFQYWMAEKTIPNLTQFAQKIALFVRYPF